MKIQTAIFLLLFVLTGAAKGQILLHETEVDTSTVITGLDVPWEIIYGPDDYLWVTERFGRVSRVHPGTGEQITLLDLSGLIHEEGEGGLLGMALHPGFPATPWIYLAYTYSSEGMVFLRIARYTRTNDVLGAEYIVIDSIPGANVHNGSRIVFAPDGTMLITTGDAKDHEGAQDLSKLNGKILRVWPDGSIPADNPWPGSPVYSFGHRNPQGLFLAENGILYSSEHGPATDDEVNIIMEGRNYGWPAVNGYCDLFDEYLFCQANNVAEPIAAFTPTIAPAGIVFYNHPSIPEFEGSLLLTTLKNKRLYVLHLNEQGTEVTSQSEFFTELWGRLRDVCVAPDGAVYLATNGSNWQNTEPFTHKIIKIWNPVYTSATEGVASSQHALKVYPNPAGAEAMVEVLHAGNRERPVLHLFDLTGKPVLQDIVLTGNPYRLDLGDVKPGLYSVTVTFPAEPNLPPVSTSLIVR